MKQIKMTRFYRVLQYAIYLSLIFCVMESGIFADDFDDFIYKGLEKRKTTTGNINIFRGTKTLEKSKWDYVNEQSEFGGEIDFKKKEWPFSIALEFLGSSAEKKDMSMTGKTTEFNIGAKKIWESFGSIHPFVGGGLSYITAEFTKLNLGGLPDYHAGANMGMWLGGGVYWTVSNFNMGIEFKKSTGSVKLSGIDMNTGGSEFGVFIGARW